MTIERIERTPSNLRWKLAEWLSKWANQLRGHKAYELAYGIKGNRAAMLGESLALNLIAGTYPIEISEEDADSMRSKVYELDKMAQSTWWQDPIK